MILKEEYPWEVFFDVHFRPGEHFLPLSPDFSNVEEKIAWCDSNPEACREMIAKRHELASLLIDPAARAAALQRVVERYNQFYADWAANSGA